MVCGQIARLYRNYSYMFLLLEKLFFFQVTFINSSGLKFYKNSVLVFMVSSLNLNELRKQLLTS